MALRILVVDDDVGVLALLEEVLLGMGAESYPLMDSQQALQQALEERFDGLVVDILMPGVDGLEFIRQVRHSGPNRRAPIVAVSGSGQQTTMEQALAAGATFFLHKPFDYKNLTRMLNSTRGSMLAERRRHTRFPLDKSVECQMGQQRFNAATQDISEGGIRLLVRRPLEVGAELSFSLDLVGETSRFQGSGRVVRAGEDGSVSLQFNELTPTARRMLRDYIADQLGPVPAK